MFGIGFSEILMIVLVLFVFVGPKKSSQLAYDLGVLLRKLKTELFHLKMKSQKVMHDTPFYEAKIELNKTLEELKKDSSNEPS